MKDWDKIDRLFHQALECPPAERAEFLARAAEDDPALRAELQALLDAHEENHSFLETPIVRVSLLPQFGRWQAQIAESLAPPSENMPAVNMLAGKMIGRLLDGKYRLEELCGRGGMGAVYRALHVGTGRRMAVKVIAPELAGNREFIERFRREAKTIGRLRHPNIVNVTDFGITGENEQTLAYLVMDYLEGCTLAAKLKDKRPLPLADALDILSQTCAAIDEAHRQGILHRDLKPENIWLEPVGFGGCNVKVLDFGIAQLHDQLHNRLALEEPEPLPVISEGGQTSEIARLQPFSITEDETLPLNFTLQQLTRSGTVLGSPKYMSPEQCRGEKLDSASDIYSLGVIAYQMLSGDLPFKGTVAELLQQHREAAPEPLSRKRINLPAQLDAVIGQALAKDPAARPATAGAFAFLLSLRPTGSDWLRRQADAVNRRDRFKLAELAVRVQWRSWLLTGSLLLVTLKLPGLHWWQTGLVFGSLWLLIAALTLWKQNSTTAACALFLEQARNAAKPETSARDIVAAVRRRRGALVKATWAEMAGFARKLLSFKPAEIRRWADSLLIVPALIQEGSSVAEAARRSARLVAPLRRKLAYPFLRRLLAFGLVLTTWQIMLAILGNTLDGVTLYGGRRELPEVMIVWLPSMLALCFIAFSLSLKSSIEQAVLYLTGRQALGEVAVESSGMPFRQDADGKPRVWWLAFKTYAPACALFLLLGYLQFLKFPLMSVAVNSREVYTVKALQAAGVPLPFWSLADTPPSGFRRRLHRVVLPFGRYIFHPYGPDIIRSLPMTEFLLEKGVDVNRRLVLDGEWTPPRVGAVSMTPLHVALTDGRVDIAQLMIAHGADVHARDSIGRSPLIVAITYCPTAIELLLASGADINEQTRFGPPLLAAARYQSLYRYPGGRRMQERENAVKFLLEKGADPNTRDSDGRNALMVMSMEARPFDIFTLPLPGGFRYKGRITPGPDQTKALRLVSPDKALQLIGEALIEAGCDVNAADNTGRTPLMYAAHYRRPDAVRLLLAKGANIKARDKSGMTALDLAKIDNSELTREIVGLLYKATGVRPRTIKVGAPGP